MQETTSYDFRQAHNLSADQSRELHDQCSNLCRALQRAVPEMTGIAARFTLERLRPGTYDEFLDGLPESPVLAVCELDQQHAPVVWQIDCGLALAYMDAMLGGDGLVVCEEEREFTILERTLVAQVVEDLLSTWTDAWPTLADAHPKVAEVRQTTGRFAIGSLQDAVMSVSISCSVAESEGHMRIALPTVVLRRLLKQANNNGIQCLPSERPRWGSGPDVAACPVVLSVRLASLQLSLKELHALQPGQVLALDRSPRDQLDVAIAGQPKYRATSGLANGRIAVRLTELLRG